MFTKCLLNVRWKFSKEHFSVFNVIGFLKELDWKNKNVKSWSKMSIVNWKFYIIPFLK